MTAAAKRAASVAVVVNGLALTLTPCGRGHSFDWTDTEGRSVLCGWHPGTVDEGLAAAMSENPERRPSMSREAMQGWVTVAARVPERAAEYIGMCDAERLYVRQFCRDYAASPLTDTAGKLALLTLRVTLAELERHGEERAPDERDRPGDWDGSATAWGKR
jgi:hypothetical protein